MVKKCSQDVIIGQDSLDTILSRHNLKIKMVCQKDRWSRSADKISHLDKWSRFAVSCEVKTSRQDVWYRSVVKKVKTQIWSRFWLVKIHRRSRYVVKECIQDGWS